MLSQKLAALSPSCDDFSATAAAAVDTHAVTPYAGGVDEVKSKSPQTPLPGSRQSQRGTACLFFSVVRSDYFTLLSHPSMLHCVVATDSEGEDGRTSSQSCDEKDDIIEYNTWWFSNKLFFLFSAALVLSYSSLCRNASRSRKKASFPNLSSWYVLVKLEDVSKEVECPLCFGVSWGVTKKVIVILPESKDDSGLAPNLPHSSLEIIRKTRAFMECLHRFCKECIDKAMRLGKKECPVCRSRCATRRSLRDDPNFDALIAALFPDINKHEEIQASMVEAFLQRSGALGQRRSASKVTAVARMKRSQGGYQPGKNSYYRRRSRVAARNVSPILSDYDEDEDGEGNDAIKRSSSSEELCTDRIHKRRRMIVPGSSTTRLDLGSENYVTEMIRTSPLPAGSKELSWGKGGVRSQTRHGSGNGPNGRFARAPRLTRLIEYLHNLDENEDKFDVHLNLLPLNEQNMPLKNPYLYCPSTLQIKHICQFIAIQTTEQVEGIDVFVRNPESLNFLPSKQVEKVPFDASEEMQILGAEESLAGLLTSFASSQGDLELMYRINVRKNI
ncbi:hypothetical protein M5K25_014426 [Dendrobium thyrsiflorum]|uniref:RING-type domain-containing protein n=1 Tax=Dendrobium thyrsiflorum TaxID=117978 RepID=A0ABD0UVK5_DENTH